MSKQDQKINLHKFWKVIRQQWQSDINLKISEIETFDQIVVQELPNVGKSKTLYFIPSSNPEQGNTYDEFIYTSTGWEQVGSTAYVPDHIIDTTSLAGKVVIKKDNRSFAVDSVEIISPVLVVKYDGVLFEGDSKAVTTTDKTGNITFECPNIPDAEIYYTLDESDPIQSNTRIKYTGGNVNIGITTTGSYVTTNTVIKVSAFKLGSWSMVRAITFAVMRKLKAPTISVVNPTSGYTQGVVTINNLNGRGTIRYTTDGSTPTSESPEFTSLSVNTKTNIKAAVFLDNWVTSDVAEEQQTFTVLDPVISIGGNSYDASRTITISCYTPNATLTYQTKKDNGAWSEGTAITNEGTFTISTKGSYQVKVAAKKTDWNDGENTSSVFSVRKVQTPSITVASGTEWDDARQISIATGSAGGTLKYSTDGGSTWNTYSAPFNISAPFNGTIKAKATKTDYTDSNIQTSETITLKLKCYIGRTATGTSTISAINDLFDKKTINATTLVGREEQNTFTASGRIWFIVPSGQTITKITSSGYLVLVELVTNQISGYNCYRRVEDDLAGIFTYKFE